MLLGCPRVRVLAADASEAVVAAAAAAAASGYQSLLNNEMRHWQELARDLKRSMEATCGGAWHAIAGRHFGAFVTHQVQGLVYLQVAQVNILLFRHG